MTWVVAGNGLIYPFIAGDVRVRFRFADGNTVEHDCLQKIHPVARNVLCGLAGSVYGGFAILHVIRGHLHADHWYSLPELTYQRFWLPRLMRWVFRGLPQSERRLGAEVLLVGAHPRLTRGFPGVARCDTIRFRSPRFEPEETVGNQCLGIGSGEAVEHYREVATDASTSDAVIRVSTVGLEAPAQLMASTLHLTVRENPFPGVSEWFLYGTVSPRELVIRPWQYEERGPAGTRQHRVPPLVQSYPEFVQYCGGARLPADAAVAVAASRGGPHPLDRCSSQLRWNPGS